MQSENTLKIFHALHSIIINLSDDEINELASKAGAENPWFTFESTKKAFEGIAHLLQPIQLEEWIVKYQTKNIKPKIIGLVCAGNIPMVGFHDILCVLMAGHKAQIKLSSKDRVLMKFLINEIIELCPEMNSKIVLAERMENFDAIIATGSSNSARYFEYYFKNYPQIIRKNRNSIAVLTGEETETELIQLGIDVFSYFGLGCRNVAKLYIPENFDLIKLGDAWQYYKEIGNHNKYANNYEYRRSIYLINQEAYLDYGFIIIKESESLTTPIAVIHYEKYSNLEKLVPEIVKNLDNIQCIVSNSKITNINTIPFGKAQFPGINDYSDNIDTMTFLTNLS